MNVQTETNLAPADQATAVKTCGCGPSCTCGTDCRCAEQAPCHSACACAQD